jgi:hypothetical protein
MISSHSYLGTSIAAILATEFATYVLTVPAFAAKLASIASLMFLLKTPSKPIQ